MLFLKCPKCEYVTKAVPGSNCLRCNELLKASDVPESFNLSAAMKLFNLPSFLSPTKIIAVVLMLICGWFGFGFLTEWKAEKKKRLEEAAIKNFDYLTFENSPAAIENVLKILPAKFSVKPPSLETLQSALADIVSKKDTDQYKENYRQTGTSERTVTFSPRIGLGNPIGRVGNATMYDGGGGSESVKVPFKTYTSYKVQTHTSNTISDLKVKGYNYFRGADDKLKCFARYEMKTEVFRNSQELPVFPTHESNNKKMSPGDKIDEKAIAENALYEWINDNWVFKTGGISDLQAMQMVSDLKPSAQNTAPRK